MSNLELLVYLYNYGSLSLRELIHLIEDLKIECPDLQSYKDKQKLLDDYLEGIENQVESPDLYNKIIETFGAEHAEVKSIGLLTRWSRFKRKVKK